MSGKPKQATIPGVTPAKTRNHTKSLAEAEQAHREKTGGFSGGLSEGNYWWTKAEADTRGMSHQAFMNHIVDTYRGSLRKETK
jgi:hypothetical protein